MNAWWHRVVKRHDVTYVRLSADLFDPALVKCSCGDEWLG
jgi:hypothetical protein